MLKLNMVQAINLALTQEMEKDDTVVVLGQDVGVNGGVFRISEGLIEKYGEDRVLDTPLAESAIVGTSIGMAMGGLKPVAEMQFSGFSYVAFSQIEGNASRMRSRSHGVFTCPMVIRMPYGGGIRALEHHSESREATYGHLPGLKVVIPSTPRNARSLLTAAIRDPDPVIFMEPKRIYRAFREEVPEEEETLEIGRARIVSEGKDITIVTWGAMLQPSLKAVDQVQKQRSLSIEVIDLLTLSPMDTVALAESVKKTGRCVVVQEAPRSFSASAEVVATLNDKALTYLEAPVRRVTGYDVVTPYFGRELLYMPDENRIRRAIEETLDFV